MRLRWHAQRSKDLRRPHIYEGSRVGVARPRASGSARLALATAVHTTAVYMVTGVLSVSFALLFALFCRWRWSWKSKNFVSLLCYSIFLLKLHIWYGGEVIMNPKATALATVAILFLVVSVLVVALRCYVRARLIKSFGSDDTVIVIATVCLLPRRDKLEKVYILIRCRHYTRFTSHLFSPAFPMARAST